MRVNHASDTSLSFLRRHKRKLIVALMLSSIALTIVSLKPFRPSCGLPDYSLGPELRIEFFEEFLLQMYRLRESEDYIWTGIFLIKGERLYLLPWERDTSLTEEATRLAALSILDWRFRKLSEPERLNRLQYFGRAAAVASGIEGDQSLAHVWCKNLEAMVTLKLD